MVTLQQASVMSVYQQAMAMQGGVARQEAVQQPQHPPVEEQGREESRDRVSLSGREAAERMEKGREAAEKAMQDAQDQARRAMARAREVAANLRQAQKERELNQLRAQPVVTTPESVGAAIQNLVDQVFQGLPPGNRDGEMEASAGEGFTADQGIQLELYV
ncbi:MAG: hypothetical protein H7831_03565 [Magnetococcus sp. WYHC-3]